MELCYSGVLVMPSSYAVMSEEEMTYTEAGGKLRVKASASTVRSICRGGTTVIGTAIGMAFGGPIVAQLLSGGILTLVYDYIMNTCGVKYKAINKSWTKSWLPNATFNLNKYV